MRLERAATIAHSASPPPGGTLGISKKTGISATIWLCTERYLRNSEERMALLALATVSTAIPLAHLTVEQVKDLQTALETLGYGIGADGLPGAVALLEQRISGGAVDAVSHPAVDIVKTFEGFVARRVR
jgi:hypothetical protein